MRATLLLALLAATGCAAVPRIIADVLPDRWTSPSGDARHAPFIAERVPDAVRVEWQSGLGRGLPGMPVVQQGLVAAVVSGGGVVTASPETGERYWSRRFNGSVAGQLVRVDDRIYLATQHRSGNAYALELRRGGRAWSRALNARAATGLVFADSALYVPTDRGEVLALRASDGAVLWRMRIHATAAQPPLVAGNELIIATTRDSLVRVERGGGTVTARLGLAGAASAPLALAGDTVVVAMFPGIIAAYAERGARELWRYDVGAPVLAAPVVTAEGVYVLTRDATLFRVGAAGAVRLAEFGGSATSSLTVTADGVLVGRLDGALIFARRDGSVVWQQQLDGSVRAPAAVRDGSVYVNTLNGRLTKLTR